MFRRVLIANRGEIALRIIRTCRELGLTTVLAHSEADANSLPAREADERVCIGPARAASSYLDVRRLVSAATAFRCDALHPGYGFLAESPRLAEACAEAKVVFIGPAAATLRALGDKIEARRLAREAGVPVIPGSPGAVADAREAAAAAAEIGYPVLLKAAAGGGGRGIRLVASPADLEREFAEAQAEAASAFGDGRLYVEALLLGMRHVEVQVVGDGQGRAVHLFERDCSLQRRRQKLMEESPAALIPERTRLAVQQAAVRLAESLAYAGAGTVEFLVRGEAFHFMEVNARLQVEHGVTEMVTGTDLVAAQISVATGCGLPWKQREITLSGHAIECRINAEDPESLAPSPGTVRGLTLPGGPGVRLDTHLFPGAEVSLWYDSLVAKVLAHHETRDQVRARMLRALDELQILGLSTNIPAQRAALLEDRFARAEV